MRRLFSGRCHISFFIFIYFASIIVGVAAAYVWQRFVLSEISTLVLSVGIVCFVIYKKYKWMISLAVIAGILTGYWRGINDVMASAQTNQFVGKYQVVTGRVSDDIVQSDGGGWQMKIKDIVIDNRELHGEIWVSLDFVEHNVRRSDTVVVSGFMQSGFGSYVATLGRGTILEVESSSNSDYGLRARDSFAGSLARHIDEPELALGLGYLLGMKSGLPEDIERQFQLLGLTHVLVASGYNLTILVTYARRIFEKISRYLSFFVGSILVGCFILVTGMSPSMSRAGLVAMLSLLVWYYGRSVHPFGLLSFAASLTLLYKPSYVQGDLGWYLSFTAFTGILVLAPLINDYFWGVERQISKIRELVISTLSAQFLTLPLILYTFGVMSPYSLIVNTLILPTVPYAMAASFIVGCLGYVLSPIADIVALVAGLFLKYAFFIVDIFGDLPGLQREFRLSFVNMLIFYGLIYIGISWLIHKTKHNFLNDKKVVD